MNYLIEPIKLSFDFEGKATRKQYWMFVLLYFVAFILLGVADYFTGLNIFMPIFYVVTLIASISIATRRLHDTQRSGWWQLIVLVPLVGIFILLFFLVSASKPDEENSLNDTAVEAV